MAAKTQMYTRFAEIGRIVLIQAGKDAGKLATIIDIVDENRALVDGPADITGVHRQVVNFKHVALTDLKVDGWVDVNGEKKRLRLPRNARQKTLSNAWKALDIQAKWNASSWAKRIASKSAKAGLTDFARFEAKVAKRSVAAKVRARLG